MLSNALESIMNESFKNNGKVNKHNMHYWHEQLRKIECQRPCNIYETISNKCIRPYFFDSHLNGEIHNILGNKLPKFIEDKILEL